MDPGQSLGLREQGADWDLRKTPTPVFRTLLGGHLGSGHPLRAPLPSAPVLEMGRGQISVFRFLVRVLSARFRGAECEVTPPDQAVRLSG